MILQSIPGLRDLRISTSLPMSLSYYEECRRGTSNSAASFFITNMKLSNSMVNVFNGVHYRYSRGY